MKIRRAIAPQAEVFRLTPRVFAQYRTFKRVRIAFIERERGQANGSMREREGERENPRDSLNHYAPAVSIIVMRIHNRADI